jgi:pilus assembly protein CpaF
MTMIETVAAGVLARVRGSLAIGAAPGEAALVAMVRAASADAGRLLGADDVMAVTERVKAALWGLGPLQPLVESPGATDVLVNGPEEVWVDRGEGLVRVHCPLGTEEDVRALAVRLAAGTGRRLDEASPWVDARLDRGVRLHAVIPPLSPAGTLISLRMLRREPFDLPALVQAGCVPPSWAEVLTALVSSRAAFLISGGTGAGKTTLLATLLSLAPPAERLVLVEDVGELRPRHPHIVRLEARHANVEGRGAVTLEDLVRQALRMRPDRLVVGECRGPEVRDLLAALNTGHAGGCGTVHANAAVDVPARLEALGALAGLSGPAIRAQVVAALDAIVHVERLGSLRRVVEIATVERSDSGELSLRPALTASRRVPDDPGRPGPGWPALARRLGLAETGWSSIKPGSAR